MSPHLIVCEDDPQQRELLVGMLRTAGFELTVCTDGQEALDAARRATPAAIISDALMPRLDGFQLCLALRRDPGLCHLPFILYTATYTERDDEAFAREIGCDAFVRKPDQSPELVHIIRANIARLAALPTRTAPP
jgi:CheY-like chemotaxis protein